MCPVVHPYAKLGRGFVYPEYTSVYHRTYNYKVRNYRLIVKFDFERKCVKGRAEIDAELVNDHEGWIDLDASEISIEYVTVNGREAKWSYDGQKLAIRVEGKGARVVVEYSAMPRKGLHFVLPDDANPKRNTHVWSQGETNYNRFWMPLPDHPHMKFPTEVVATVPKGMLVVSNGDLVSVTDEGEFTTWHYRMERPHSGYLISVVAGIFEEIKDDSGEPHLYYYVPPGWRDKVHLSFSKTRKILDFFGEYLGYKYPFKRYSQVAVGEFIFGGMENTTATTLTELTLHDEKAHVDFSSDPLVAHELAHQWFGDIVTCRDWPHIWLNESMATFLENLFVRHDKGEEEFVYEMIKDMDSYLEEYKEKYSRPIVTRLYKYASELFDAHSYPKGGLLVNMLRALLGEEVFRKGLNTFLRRFEYGTADTEDFRKVMEEVSGRNLEVFFEQFFYNAGHPSLKVHEGWDEERKHLVVKIRQTQSEDSLEAYWLPLKIEVKTQSGKRIVEVELTEREETVIVPLEERPELVCVDPNFEVFKTLEYERTDVTWSKVLKEDVHVYCRVLAARALGKLGGAIAADALRSAMLNDPFWGVAAEAAKALGECGGDAARAYLLEGLKVVKNAKVRRAICDALGKFRGDDVASALTQVLKDDGESYYVRQSAAISLGKQKDPKYREILIEVIDVPSHNYAITIGVLRGLSEIGDEESLKVIMSYTSDDRPTLVRAAAITCLGRFPGRRYVVEILSRHARSENYRIRQAVIAACKELMSQDVLPILETLTNDVYEMNRRAARDVAEKIRSHLEKGTEYRALKEELAKVREENRRLIERITLISKLVESKG